MKQHFLGKGTKTHRSCLDQMLDQRMNHANGLAPASFLAAFSFYPIILIVWVKREQIRGRRNPFFARGPLIYFFFPVLPRNLGHRAWLTEVSRGGEF